MSVANDLPLEAAIEDEKKRAPKKNESTYLHASKSRSTKSNIQIAHGDISKSKMLKPSGSFKSKKKKKQSNDNLQEAEATRTKEMSVDVLYSSSSSSSTEEEKEVKPKKSFSKKKSKAADDIPKPKKILKDIKDIKESKTKHIRGREDDDEMTEDEIISEFVKTKSTPLKAPPPIPDPGPLIKEAIAKIQKKFTKKEEVEEMSRKAEEEILKHIEMEKQKRADEQERMMEKEKRELIDAQLREDQLGKSVKMIDSVIQFFRQFFQVEKEQKDWELYLQCHKSPSPADCPKMTTYLRMWGESFKTLTIQEAVDTTPTIMEMIDGIEEVIALATEEEQYKLPNWYWIRSLFRSQQKFCMDVATYNLLKDVNKNMQRENIHTATYICKNDYITICVWVLVQTPIPLPNPRRPPRPRLDMTFKELRNFKVLLPYVLDCHKKAIRVMYVKYDHYSDTSETSNPPSTPPQFELDLLTTCKKEYRMKMMYKYSHRDKKVLDPENPEDEEEPEEFESDEEIPIVPHKYLNPTPSDYVMVIEEYRYNQARKSLLEQIPNNPKVLNLRQYNILGGVFTVKYLEQPPQPAHYATMTHIQTANLFIPQELKEVPFFVDYEPPAEYIYIDPNAFKQPEPEIIEEYEKQQAELDTLIFICLKVPRCAVFIKVPKVCMWLESEKCWTTRYIHETKFDEEFQKIMFRTQCFGAFALANPRFVLLPYKTWEIKPESDGSVLISIITTVINLEFTVKGGLICLSLVENIFNRALNEHVGEFMKFHLLKKMLKNFGIDIFPEVDSYFYVEGSLEKNWPLEKHLYITMAALCGYFNFTWSKWNSTLSRKNIIFQMREYSPDKSKTKSFNLMLASPLKCIYLKCPEDTPEFNTDPIDDLKFSPDLYNLMKNTVSMFLKNAVEDYPKLNVYVVSEFLIATRLLSFS